MLEVHVAADNCTDGTAMVARAHGVEVHERHAPGHGGKGPALQWLLSSLLERGEAFDAVVVVDADTTVRPDVLRIVDQRLSRGADVVQTYYAVADAEASAITGFRAAALAARHYLRPLGRNWFGGSSGLYGNGMVFRTDVLARRAWTNHLTEDNELQLELLLAGTTVDFAPDAVIEAEMPTTIDASVSQHQRWERGRMEMVTRYELPLVRKAIGGGPAGRLAYVDAALDQLVPPFSVLALAGSAWTAVALTRVVVRPSGRAWRDVALALAVLAAQSFHVLSALRMVKAPQSVYRSLGAAPRLVLWKVRLWVRMATSGRDVAWVRTSRNPAVVGP
jgi:cellulose synthase/poly-beta-1,6-N-acetylglucosamine synthase-like glycosyltransferase